MLPTSPPYSLLHGDAQFLSPGLPDESVQCIFTSPPYWGQREYDSSSGLGDERNPGDYVRSLQLLFRILKDKLRSDGSLWLNLGDKYLGKNLMGMPWRVALALQEDGWILRNDVIWEQTRVVANTTDRLKDSHEHVFHFVKNKTYLYDADAVRIPPTPKPTSGRGHVSGAKYRRLIAEHLSGEQRESAESALDRALADVREGSLNDFRMAIRGASKATHGDGGKTSRRAGELARDGFYILKTRALGRLPGDVWRLPPAGEKGHYAAFPEELLTLPIKATTRVGDVVLDPFSGTGTAVAAAVKLGRRGLGFDTSGKYVALAHERLRKIAAQE